MYICRILKNVFAFIHLPVNVLFPSIKINCRKAKYSQKESATIELDSIKITAALALFRGILFLHATNKRKMGYLGVRDIGESKGEEFRILS